jgi:hypothetical protein
MAAAVVKITLICLECYGMNKVVVAGDDALPAVSEAMTSIMFCPNTP